MTLYLNRCRMFEHLKALVGFVIAGCLWAGHPADSFGQSPLRIEITGVGTKLIPVAVPPLDAQDPQARLAQITSEVIRNNLSRSGSINLIPTGTPQPALNESTPVASIWAPWSDRGAAAMVVGSLTSVADGRMETRFVLLDVQRNNTETNNIIGNKMSRSSTS